MSKTWSQLREESVSLVDAYGMSMDDAVVDIVTSLRFRGFTTILSCGGHSDRSTGGPYVVIVHPESKRLLKESNDPDAKAKARRMTAKVASDLYRMLKGFYSERSVDYGVQIIIQMLGNDAFRISCHESGFMIDDKLDNYERQRLIGLYQKEMNDFSDYLRECIKPPYEHKSSLLL